MIEKLAKSTQQTCFKSSSKVVLPVIVDRNFSSFVVVVVVVVVVVGSLALIIHFLNITTSTTFLPSFVVVFGRG
jgi:hypothetical protein